MSRVTTLQYARIAQRVYEIDKIKDISKLGNKGAHSVDGFACKGFAEGTGWGEFGTEFKGCAYINDGMKEVVVAYQGTDTSKGGDLLADVKIGLQTIPNYCGAAMKLFEKILKDYPKHKLSLTGHSLGGGVAQVVGHWSGAPFVTFNAPGMWSHLQASKLKLYYVSDLVRSWKGTFQGSMLAKQRASTGRNFRNVLDPVSAYGSHYGSVTRFWGTDLHSMDDMVETIEKSHWASINPFDPTNKEWGELD